MRGLSAICLVLLIVGCVESQRRSDGCPRWLAEEHLAEGDLLFRRGTGLVGQVVTSMDRDGHFSHVGIVVRVDTLWRVVHAVPHEPDFKGDFDRVKCESVAEFLGRYPDAEFGLYRPQIDSSHRKMAARHALRQSQKRVPFDHGYDLADTTRLYCTELIEYCYGLQGLSLSEGRRTEVTFPSLSGSYIFPSDLTQSSHLHRIDPLQGAQL